MKKTYNTPEANNIVLEASDIITFSIGNSAGGEDLIVSWNGEAQIDELV